MAEGGGVDLFELALRISERGHEQAIEALELIEHHGASAALSMSGMQKVLLGLGGLVAAAGLGELAVKTIEAGAEAQGVAFELQQSIENAGGSFEILGERVEEAADRMQRFTRFTDEDAKRAFSTMLTITNDSHGSLENLSLAADLAAKKHMDLQSAAEMVGRAMQGNTRFIDRMFPSLKQSTDKLGDLRNMLAGFAEKEGQTFNGQLQIMKNNLEEVFEKLGMAILGTGGLGGGLNALTEQFIKAQEWVKTHREQIQAWVVDITNVGKAAWEFLSVIGAAFRGAQIILIEFMGYNETIGPSWKFLLATLEVDMVNFAEEFAQTWDKLFGTHLEDSLDEFARLALKRQREAAAQVAIVRSSAEAEIKKLREGIKDTDAEVEKHKKTTEGGGDTTPFALPIDFKALDKDLKVATEAIKFEVSRAEGLALLASVQSRANEMVKAGTGNLEERAHVLGIVGQAEEVMRKLTDQQVASAQTAITQGSHFVAGVIDLTMAMSDQRAEMVRSSTTMLRRVELTKQLTDETDKLIKATRLPVISVRRPQDVPGYIDPVGPRLTPQQREAMGRLATQLQSATDAKRDQFENIGTSIATVISGGLAAGLSKAMTGDLSGALTAFGTVILQGFGSILGQLGDALIQYGILMTALLPALENIFTSGPAAIAAGIALKALGSVFGGIVGGGGKGSSGGGGGVSAASPRLEDYTRITLGTPSATVAAGMTPLQAVTFNVIGPNDPRAFASIQQGLAQNSRRSIAGA